MAQDPPSLEDASEPAVLGAAPTLEFKRETRAERAERKRAAREARASSTPPRATEPVPSGVPTPASTPPAPGQVEYVFEPRHTANLDLRDFFPELSGYIRDIWQRRRFLTELARADVRRRHANTALGALWSILEPMFQIAIYFMLFTIIRRGSRPIEFLPVLVWGIFCFQLVMSALSEGGMSIQRSSSLMLNSTFPRALLPIATVYKGILRFVPTVGVFVPVYVAVGSGIHAGLLFLPLLFLVQVALSIGLSLVMATLMVYVRDIKNAMNYVTRIFFFTTPVIYPLTLLPGGLKAVLQWQPLFGLFAAYQQIVDGGMPSASYIALGVGWSVVLVLVGAFVFMRNEREFANLL